MLPTSIDYQFRLKLRYQTSSLARSNQKLSSPALKLPLFFRNPNSFTEKEGKKEHRNVTYAPQNMPRFVARSRIPKLSSRFCSGQMSKISKRRPGPQRLLILEFRKMPTPMTTVPDLPGPSGEERIGRGQYNFNRNAQFRRDVKLNGLGMSCLGRATTTTFS